VYYNNGDRTQSSQEITTITLLKKFESTVKKMGNTIVHTLYIIIIIGLSRAHSVKN